MNLVGKLPDGTYVKIRKALYGLAAAPRAWQLTLEDSLRRLGFEQSEVEPCLWRATIERGTGEELIIHVDDLLSTAEDAAWERLVRELKEDFKFSDLGLSGEFLGMLLEVLSDPFGYKVSQPSCFLRCGRSSSCGSLRTKWQTRQEWQVTTRCALRTRHRNPSM